MTSLPGTSLADIDLLRLRIYCEQFRRVEFDDSDAVRLLSNWQRTDNQGQCTVNGALFFGNSLARLLPQAGIQLFHFEGCDRTGAIIDQRELCDRNPNIAQHCKDYELAEKAGRGLQKIFKTYRERNLPTPEIVNDPPFFQVVLKMNRL